MKVEWIELEISGLYRSTGASLIDSRGAFTKILSGPDPRIGDFEGREIYWTSSVSDVIRGFHFQLPPHSTRKLVTVVNGAVRDFVIDLRVGSPTAGHVAEIALDSTTGGLLVPAGCAHAYESLQDNTIVVYAQDIPFAGSETYGGINFDSVGISPSTKNPIRMPRDLDFPDLEDFASPFTWSHE